MRFLGDGSGARLTLLLVVSLAELGTRRAAAAPPACFPTRYLGKMASLVGDRKFGMLAPGQLVTVLDNEVPFDLPPVHYTFARIEIERPVHLTALVLPTDLYVFLRRDVPIEPGATWWLAGTAMRAIAVHDGRVEIDRAGTKRQFPVTVRCDDLVSDPPGGTAKARDGCDACIPEPPHPAPPTTGPAVCWKQRSFEVKVPGSSGANAVIDSSNGMLVRRESQRVLVEIISGDLRLWRWLPARALKRDCGDDGRTVAIGSLCTLKSGVDPRLLGAVLDRPAPLLPAPGSPPLTMLPAGTVLVWDQDHAGLRRVLIRWPNADWSDSWTLQLVGFVSSAALRDAPAPKRAKWSIGMPDWAHPFAPRSVDAGPAPER